MIRKRIYGLFRVENPQKQCYYINNSRRTVSDDTDGKVLSVFTEIRFDQDVFGMKIFQGRSVFGNWQIAELIGEGDFGSVYRLTKTEDGKEHISALRVVTVPRSAEEVNSLEAMGYSDDDIYDFFSEKAARLDREISQTEKLSGLDNIVSYAEHTVIKSSVETRWDILIRMELLTPLENVLQTKGIMLSEVLKLGIDICHALEICEQNGIPELEIRPEHIFVSPDGDYKLGDLGMTKIARKSSGVIPKSNVQIYTAPEIYAGKEHRPCSDLYSIGLILYKLLNNNKLPFSEYFSGTPDEKAIFGELMKGRKLPPPVNASEKQFEIISKACAFDPEKRYQTPYELRMDLASEFNGLTDKQVYFPPVFPPPSFSKPAYSETSAPPFNSAPPSFSPPPYAPPVYNAPAYAPQVNTPPVNTPPVSRNAPNSSGSAATDYSAILEAKKNNFGKRFIEVSRTENSITLQSKKSYSLVALILLTIFLSWFGINRFYEKKYLSGLLYLCTCGLFYCGAIFDIISMLVSIISNRLSSRYNIYKVITVTGSADGKSAPVISTKTTRG